jgi:hypothetical protein
MWLAWSKCRLLLTRLRVVLFGVMWTLLSDHVTGRFHALSNLNSLTKVPRCEHIEDAALVRLAVVIEESPSIMGHE